MSVRENKGLPLRGQRVRALKAGDQGKAGVKAKVRLQKLEEGELDWWMKFLGVVGGNGAPGR